MQHYHQKAKKKVMIYHSEKPRKSTNIGFGKHEHSGIGNKCIYCGTSSYGRGCIFSPNDRHKHETGSGSGKCVYCSSSSHRRGCIISPFEIHEH